MAEDPDERRVAVVTGAASGLGSATARALTAAGGRAPASTCGPAGRPRWGRAGCGRRAGRDPRRDLGPDAVTVDELVADPASPPSPEVAAAAVSRLGSDAAGAVVGQLPTLGRGGPLRP